MKVNNKLSALVGGLGLLFASAPALAQMELNMPVGVTSISRDVYQLHMWILWIVTIIGVLVFGAMIYAIVRFRRSKHPNAAQFHHSTTVEIVWTVIPLLILIGMAIPATRVLVDMYNTEESDLTVKVTGYQWRWGYEYVGEDVSFISTLDANHNLARQRAPEVVPASLDNYLLEVDKELVLPVGKKVRFLLTSNDVIHSWWVPEFGWKKDAIPGFINEAWTRIDEPGVYRGQCAELCGRDHAFMPVVVRAVPEEEFNAWLEQQRGGETPTAQQASTPIEPQEDLAGPSETVVETAEAGEQLEAVDEPVAELSMDVLMERGEQVYAQSCVSCHQANGQGMPPAFPAIAGGPISTGDVAEHIDIVLHGRNAMPPWGHLSDEDIAAVVTYERNAFGNDTGDLVQPADVAGAR